MMLEQHSVSGLAALLQNQKHAFQRLPVSTLAQRKKQLALLRQTVIAWRCAIKTALSADFGYRSSHETDLIEISASIQAIDYLIKNLSRFMKKERRHVGLLYQGGKAWVEYQPLGVIGILSPWNYPLSLTLIPLATAIAAGNHAMIKPSELTPNTSAVLEKILAKVFSPEQVTIICGGPEVGAQFSALPFDHLFFTGSPRVGRSVLRAASEHLVPVTLELGGKCPVIISQGANTAQAINSIVFGKLTNAGQTCIAPDYVFVHESEVDTFISAFARTAKKFYPGGINSKDYSSIINQHHYQRIQDLIDDARKKGAKVIDVFDAGEPTTKKTNAMAPLLVMSDDDQLHIAQEEIFGPLLLIKTWKNSEDVVDYINARPRPLALYYFGDDAVERDMFLQRTISGNVCVNSTMIHAAIDDLPFGGVGESGMGAYHGIEGFRAMSHAKGVFVQYKWRLPAMIHAPFGKIADFTLSFMLRARHRSLLK
jgi:coniferyl-aldehyde dehydrogenase